MRRSGTAMYWLYPSTKSIVELMLAKNKVLCYTEVNTDPGDGMMRKVISDLPVRIQGRQLGAPTLAVNGLPAKR